MFHSFRDSPEMQTSFGWIPLLTLLLSHVASDADAFPFLEEPCGNTNQAAPWMAAITNYTHFLCGGTLINKEFVLAAAHCMVDHGDLIVALGASNPSLSKETYRVILAVIHNSYEADGNRNDIGLLKLSRPVVYNVHISPICIILDKTINNQISYEKTLKAFAWDLISKSLQTITINRLDRSSCYSIVHGYPNSKQICAVGSNEQICDFESGPLTIFIRANNIVKTVIVGHGKISCSWQGVYTDVTSYVDWIKTNVKAFATLESPKPKIWLYNDCSGNTLHSKLRAQIYAPYFMGQGVFITDRFIITNARGLPEDADSLDVGLAGTPRIHNEFRVDAIFKHRESSDFKNDVALLKLRQSVTIDGFKPICMFARINSPLSPFTTFDYVQTEEHVHIYRYTVELFNNQICSTEIGRAIKLDQVCVRTPPGVSQNYGRLGDILGKEVMYLEKEWLVLLGIVSYSSNGLQVFTNLMAHTDWIANIVNSNQFQ